MRIQKILNQQLSLIKPSDKEIKELEKTAGEFISLLKKNKLKAEVGGSLAKGTVVKKHEKQDIDIFVVFDFSEDIVKLEKILTKIKLPGTLKKIHGSRDYFRIETEKALLEVIPVVENKDPETAENVTDVSLSHVHYIKKEIEKNPQIADEIRLAKSFCAAQRCYGAESYIKGFSGYSLEVLIIYFKSFPKFLKGIQKKKIIDPHKYFKNEREILRELNTSKIQGPLILIDPTYKYRNIAAGLGQDTFDKFKQSAKSFLKSPSPDFFKYKEMNINELKKLAEQNKAKLIQINLKTKRQEGDIAGTKMKKFLDFFADELKRKQQEIIKKEFEYPGEGQSSVGYLIIKEKNEIEIKGPNIGLEEAVKNFSKSKKNVYKKNGHIWTTEKTSIEKIFNQVKKIEKEMHVQAEIKLI
jgi:tRNA nucleotidyltransferase (CCA-adding enzyme)